jgi:16S rRNA processing protein RimM
VSSLIRVGQIVGAFGIKGQVKVLPLTDFAERFDPGRRLKAGDQWLTVKSVLEHGAQLVLSFQEFQDRTTAENLQWEYLEAIEDERPELDEDEYLTRDLIGLAAISPQGDALGTIADVLLMPAHDVFVIRQAGREDILVPGVKEFIKKVDLKNKTITIELLPGMLEGGDVS